MRSDNHFFLIYHFISRKILSSTAASSLPSGFKNGVTRSYFGFVGGGGGYFHSIQCAHPTTCDNVVILGFSLIQCKS